MAQQLLAVTCILRRKQVEASTGYSRSTIYLRIADGLWTRPVSLGARAVGWPASEVEALNAARIAGKADPEIRALVLELEAARGGVPRPQGAHAPQVRVERRMNVRPGKRTKSARSTTHAT